MYPKHDYMEKRWWSKKGNIASSGSIDSKLRYKYDKTQFIRHT